MVWFGYKGDPFVVRDFPSWLHHDLWRSSNLKAGSNNADEERIDNDPEKC